MDPESKRRPGQGASPEEPIAGERNDNGSVSPGSHRREGDLERFLSAISGKPGTVVELRALRVDRARVVSGYFDDPKALAREAKRIDGRAEGVYVTLNPVLPALLARASNRLVWNPKGTTKDDEILRRQFMLVDLDPKRPSGISSSAAEREASVALGTEIRDYLSGLGFPRPIVADSGNGTHLLYRLDLPVDDGSLLSHCLTALAFRFDTEAVCVDPGVFNPARISKLYGTMACKGDETSDRPHHRSALLDFPEELVAVPEPLLHELASHRPQPLESGHRSGRNGHSAVDVDHFLREHRLQVAREGPWKDGRRWILESCPFEPEHRDRAAYVVQFASGAIAAGCHHTSCNGLGWRELRDRLGAAPVASTRPAAGNRGGRSGSRPQPPTKLAPYQPFPTELLPDPLSTFVAEASAAIGCDPCYVALPLLASVAAAIGNTRRIRLKAQWCEPSVLWTVIVGESGSLKSPAMDLALDPIRRRQQVELERHVEALASYREALLGYEAERKAWTKADSDGPPPSPPAEPRQTRYLCSDVTVEALAVLLGHAPRGLLLARDELSGWLRSFDAYRKGRGGDSARWLEMNRAGHVLVDRKSGSSDLLVIPRAAVSVTGSIQPEILRTTLGREHLANGMAARLLLAMPPRRAKEWTDREVSQATLRKMDRLFDSLLVLGFAEGTTADPVDVPLSGQARRTWVEFYNAHSKEQTELAGDLAAAWSKIEAYAARFALVVHCVRTATLGHQPNGSEEVASDSVAAGVSLARWFAAEATRVYAVLGESAGQREVRGLVERIQLAGGSITARELMRRSRRYRTNATEAEGALQELADLGLGSWRQKAVSPAGGRPVRTFELVNALTPTGDGD